MHWRVLQGLASLLSEEDQQVFRSFAPVGHRVEDPLPSRFLNSLEQMGCLQYARTGADPEGTSDENDNSSSGASSWADRVRGRGHCDYDRLRDGSVRMRKPQATSSRGGPSEPERSRSSTRREDRFSGPQRSRSTKRRVPGARSKSRQRSQHRADPAAGVNLNPALIDLGKV